MSTITNPRTLLLLFFIYGIHTVKAQSVTLPAPCDAYVSFHDDPTSVSVHWNYSNMSTESLKQVQFFGLNITYLGPCTGYTHNPYNISIMRANTTGTNFSYTLIGLQEFSTYNVSIDGVSGAQRRSSEVTVTFQTHSSAPGLVPRVQVTFINSSAMTVEWEPIPCLQKNGIIEAYMITITNRNREINRQTSYSAITHRLETLQPPLRFTHNGLAPSTDYSVNVRAVNTNNMLSNEIILMYNSTTGAGFIGFLLKGQRYYENELVAAEDIEEYDNALLCLTIYRNCCSSTFTGLGRAIGEWYFPDNTMVPIQARSDTAYRNRWNGTVRLNRRLGIGRQARDLQGMFTCEIPNHEGELRNLTIGIFPRDGGKLKLKSVPQFEVSHVSCCKSTINLTYITSGGPATTVVWEKNDIILNNSETTSTDSLLIDKNEATYIHTLSSMATNVTGLYRVTVANSKSSITSNISIISIPIQLLLKGVPDCNIWIAQESRTSSLSNETMILFSHLWEGVQHVCPDRIGINIFVSYSTLRCNSDGDHMTFRTILTTKEPQNSSKSLLSCIEQWIDTVGTVSVQNLSLRIVQQCPLLISSFDTPMCIVLRSSDIPECTSQPKSQVSASPPWLLITIVLASFLCFLLAASTVLNITLSSYTIKYKKKLREMASNKTSTQGFTNMWATNSEINSQTNSRSNNVETENKYQPHPESFTAFDYPAMAPNRGIHRSNTIDSYPSQIVHSQSEKEKGKPATIFIRTSQSSHNISLTASGRVVQVQTDHRKDAGVIPSQKVKPTLVAEKPKKLGRTKVRHKAENIPSPESSGYAGLMASTREEPHNYASLDVTQVNTRESVVYAIPGPPTCTTAGETPITAGDAAGRNGVYYNHPFSKSEYKNL